MWCVSFHRKQRRYLTFVPCFTLVCAMSWHLNVFKVNVSDRKLDSKLIRHHTLDTVHHSSIWRKRVQILWVCLVLVVSASNWISVWVSSYRQHTRVKNKLFLMWCTFVAYRRDTDSVCSGPHVINNKIIIMRRRFRVYIADYWVIHTLGHIYTVII